MSLFCKATQRRYLRVNALKDDLRLGRIEYEMELRIERPALRHNICFDLGK